MVRQHLIPPLVPTSTGWYDNDQCLQAKHCWEDQDSLSLSLGVHSKHHPHTASPVNLRMMCFHHASLHSVLLKSCTKKTKKIWTQIYHKRSFAFYCFLRVFLKWTFWYNEILKVCLISGSSPVNAANLPQQTLSSIMMSADLRVRWGLKTLCGTS